VKFGSLRHRLKTLEALLPTEPVRIKVTGGLKPAAAEPAKPEPGGRELAEQAAAFRRARQAPEKPAGVENPVEAEIAPVAKRAPGAS
jgi:hypothetical protein